ncbi:MAG: hypothetical protein ACSNEK_09855 [Parachlamydiaceae bacterium]
MNPLNPSKQDLNINPGEVAKNEKVNFNETLPVEIFHKVLSELNENNLQSALRVNSFWNTAVLSVIQRREFSDIKNFARVLGNHLIDSYKIQREQLFNIGKDKMLLEIVNLKQIKVPIHELKEEMINILKELDSYELKYLQQLGVSSPKFFDDTFVLARIYRKVDKAKAMPPGQSKDKRRSLTLKTTAESLIKLGYLDKALEAATAIPSTGFGYNRLYRYYLLDEISNAFLQRGDLGKSLITALLYQNKEELRLFVTKSWLEEGNLSKALEMIDLNQVPEIVAMLPDTQLKSLVLDTTSRKWIEKGNLSQASDTAVMISDKAMQSLALEAISRAWLEKKNNIGKALEVAEMIPNETIKSSLIKDILS